MRLNRRFTLAAAVVGALVVSSVALAAGGVAGTYKTTITNSGQLNGKWVARARQGRHLHGGDERQGTGSREILGDRDDDHVRARAGSGCAGSGMYAWKKSGKTVTFIRKRETASCQRTRSGAHSSVHAGAVGRTR